MRDARKKFKPNDGRIQGRYTVMKNTAGKRKDCTIRVYVSSGEKQAIKARMQQLGFKTPSEYLRYVLKVDEIRRSKEPASPGGR